MPEKSKDIVEADSGRELNILMIYAKYDQAFELDDLKESMGKRLDIDKDDVQVNQLYGSFKEGNASMIFLDDNSDHFTTAYDQDFIRETRDWVINTFPKVKPIDQNFYANWRGLIFIMQILGGLGAFFLLIELISNTFVKQKRLLDDKENNEEKDIPDSKNETMLSIILKTIGFSLIFALPGMIIMIPVFLFLPLSIAGFALMLMFGQAFGLLVLLWWMGRKENYSLKEMLSKPFKTNRNVLVKHLILGATLSVLLIAMLYLSLGLNYLGMIPSITKLIWIPAYFTISFILFYIYNLLFQERLQARYGKKLKDIIKLSFINIAIISTYLTIIILLLCFLMGSFFFIIMLYIAIPLFSLTVFVSSITYEKTGNIIPGIIINATLIIFLVSTLSPFMTGLEYISVFSN
ncbi:MAG: hypothetical protein GF383_14605 [Candidatus Lokiarchaeota archaeon]|nr:hypothetical protein [Candidatus Lokiarchaeota archaeon]